MTSFQALNASLKAAGAQWVADETPLSKLTSAEKARRLGVVIDRAALAKAMAPRAQVDMPKFDREVDWRNRNGNKVTPVKDQGGCGSCTSFSVVGAVESIALIELGQVLNLSEADLHFCSSHGATCDGWWPDAAYESLRTRGVTDEAHCPYTNAFNGANPVCHVADDRAAHVVRITASTALQSAVARKNWLTQVGPCVAAFHVFDDFFSYRSGVYQHVSGAEVGLHSVMIIGYSEAEQCWLCKNSWGTGWGMQGFFKIAYGAAGIDTEFPFWTAHGVKLPTQFGDGPGVVIRQPTQRDVFVRGLDNQLWQKYWDGSRWSDWFPLGGQISAAPSVASARPEHVDIYARGMDNQLWQKYWDGGQWSDWLPLGGQLAAAPGVVIRQPTRRDVFVRGLDNQLWQKYWDGSRWSDWLPLGGQISSAPSVVSAGPKHIDVYARGMDNQLWQKYWDGGRWSDWLPLGGQLTAAPGVVARSPKHRDVFVRGLDRCLWHKWWASDSGWSGWARVDGVPIGSAPAAASPAYEHVDVYVRGEDGQLHQKYWLGGSGWSDWKALGGQLAPTVSD